MIEGFGYMNSCPLCKRAMEYPGHEVYFSVNEAMVICRNGKRTEIYFYKIAAVTHSDVEEEKK